MSIHVATAAPDDRSVSLPAIHILLLGAYGVVLWWLAALLIRSGTPAGLFTGAVGLITYAATVAVAYLLARLGAWLPRLGPGRILPGMVVPCVSALFCDSMTVTWMPSLYGPDGSAMLPGIAWLFFGVSACLGFAFAVARR